VVFGYNFDKKCTFARLLQPILQIVNNESEKEIKFIPVEDLLFDPRNPRLPSAKTGATDEEVFRYMLDNGNLVDILLSIATQGYFQGEPLLVAPAKHQPGKYEVLEGNRRLAALKLLLNPDLTPAKKETVKQIAEQATYRPDSVPVLIYSSRQEVLLYLGYRHITGVDQWGSLAKAKYLSQLQSEYSELDYVSMTKQLAKIIGSRSDYVHKLLSGYQLYQKIEENNFFKIPNLDEESFQFSLLTTALSYSNINNYVTGATEDTGEESTKINLDHLKDLTEWIYKEIEGRTRLGESRNLKTLNAVVSVPRALKAFKEHGRPLEEAKLLTDEPREIFSNSIRQALARITDAKSQSHHVQHPSPADQENLRDLVQIARELYTVVRNKIDQIEDI
jgi:hypothetical protein